MSAVKTTVDPTAEAFKQNHQAMLERIDDLSVQLDKALAGGGEKYVDRHHKRGKLTARERIELLVGDRGAGVDVVELVVPPNLAAERFDAFSRRGRHGSDGQPRQRSRVATNSVSASRASRSGQSGKIARFRLAASANAWARDCA